MNKEFKLNGITYEIKEDQMPDYGDSVIVNHSLSHVIEFDENCAAVSDEYDFTVVEAIDCDEPFEL